jgi:hypothetical protein
MLALLALSIAIPASLVFGAVVAAATVWEGHAVAHSHHELKHLEFGYPLKWVDQNQSQYSPGRYPDTVPFESPMESPINVHPGLLFANVALLAAVGIGAFLAIAGGFALVALPFRRQPPTTA